MNMISPVSLIYLAICINLDFLNSDFTSFQERRKENPPSFLFFLSESNETG